MEIVRQKNVATRIVFPLVDADGDLVSGATSPDSEIDQWADGANPTGFADCTNEATEIGSTGIYYLSLTQTEMNEDYIVVQIKSGTAKTQVILIRTLVGDPLNLATTDDGGAINVATGVVEAQVKSIDANAITATSIASDAITAAKIATGAIDADAIADNAIDAAAIASGAITSAKFAAGAITATVIATDAIDADALAADAIAEINATVDTALADYDAPTSAELVSEINSVQSDIAALNNPSAAAIADAVWDEDVVAAHTTADTAGKLLNDTEAAVDTEIAAIKAKTDNLPTDPADASVVAGLIAAVETKVDTVDTVVDAIKVTTDKLDDTLEDDAGTYRFTENALEEAPSGGGGGATAAQIADAVWDEKVDDHLSDRSFGMKIGIHIPFVAPDFDYKRIKKIIDEAVSSQKLPEVDMEPISVALQGLYEEIRGIDIPEAEKADFSPVLSRINDVEKAVKAIKIPETDLSPIEKHLDKQDKIIKPQVEEIRDTLEKMLGRIRQYFDGDMDAFKREVESIKEAFESIPYVVMEVRDKPKPTEPKEPKEEKKKEKPNVLEEYLKLK
jgi:hypothetical protein